MTRIEPLSPPYSPEAQAYFDGIMPPGVPPLLLFRVMATSGRAWRKLAGGSLLDRGPLTIRQREIIINRTCALAGCEYEWGVHIAYFADAADLDAKEIEALARGDAHDLCWSPPERVLVAAADALFANNKLSSDEFYDLREHYDDEQIIELIQLCGFYRTISYLVGSFDLPLESFGARFDTHPTS